MTTKARLHWFWRGAIAAAVGGLSIMAIACIVEAIRPQVVLANLFANIGLPRLAGGPIAIFLLSALGSVAPIVVHVALMRRFGPPTPDGELHCRRCDHILRGLSEPRCPECGEMI